jgi:hypothetical protein
MRRVALGILSDIGAVLARHPDCEQRHAEPAARPVPIDRYDNLIALGEYRGGRYCGTTVAQAVIRITGTISRPTRVLTTMQLAS